MVWISHHDTCNYAVYHRHAMDTGKSEENGMSPLSSITKVVMRIIVTRYGTHLSEYLSRACLESWCGRSRLCMTREPPPAASVANDMDDTSDGRAAVVWDNSYRL